MGLKQSDFNQAIKQFMGGEKTGIKIAKKPTKKELNTGFKLVKEQDRFVLKEIKG